MSILVPGGASETCYRESLLWNEKLRIIMVYSLHRHPTLHWYHNLPIDQSSSSISVRIFISNTREMYNRNVVFRTPPSREPFFFARESMMTYRDFLRVPAHAQWYSRARFFMEISLHRFESERERERKDRPIVTCVLWTAYNNLVAESTFVKFARRCSVPIFFSIKYRNVRHSTRLRLVAALSNDELAVSRISTT